MHTTSARNSDSLGVGLVHTLLSDTDTVAQQSQTPEEYPGLRQERRRERERVGSEISSPADTPKCWHLAWQASDSGEIVGPLRASLEHAVVSCHAHLGRSKRLLVVAFKRPHLNRSYTCYVGRKRLSQAGHQRQCT